MRKNDPPERTGRGWLDKPSLLVTFSGATVKGKRMPGRDADSAFCFLGLNRNMNSFATYMSENESRTALAAELERFLKAHAKPSADYDPKFPEEDKYNSPDASEMEAAVVALHQGHPLRSIPNSSWESGGYSPYSDHKAKRWHDDLLNRLRAFVR